MPPEVPSAWSDLQIGLRQNLVPMIPRTISHLSQEAGDFVGLEAVGGLPQLPSQGRPKAMAIAMGKGKGIRR